MENKTEKLGFRPGNQKALYNGYSKLVEMMLDGTITESMAATAIKGFDGMLKTYEAEIKRAQITRQAVRVIESVPFGDTSEEARRLGVKDE